MVVGVCLHDCKRIWLLASIVYSVLLANRFIFLFSAFDNPGGGCTHQADSVLLQEANPCNGGLRGGQRRWKMEADLRWGVESYEQQGDLRHVRLPCREEIQHTHLQVSVLCFFNRFQDMFSDISISAILYRHSIAFLSPFHNLSITIQQWRFFELL